MGEEVEVVRRLSAVDWNFSGTQTYRRFVHALHWFPGNFIPQIPAHFIQVLSRAGDLVVDPFCGSGTTGAEAYRLGRRSRQSDVCRASIQVAEGKLAVLRLPRLRERARSILDQLYFEELARCTRRISPELMEWYDSDTLEQLNFLWEQVSRTQEKLLRAALELVFSDVLFSCASAGGSKTRTGGDRRHHWGWIADNVKPNVPRWRNAIHAFRERLQHAVEIAEVEGRRVAIGCDVVREPVSRLSCGEGMADLVVTSPPYLGVIDYALANRMSYLWMGWDVDEDRQLELGSRRTRNHTRARERYLDGIEVAVSRIQAAMRPGAYCAVVIGASRKYEEMAERTLRVFDGQLRRVWGPVERIVTRRRVSERQGRAARELLCVLRRDR